jgi:hypothetical protein
VRGYCVNDAVTLDGDGGSSFGLIVDWPERIIVIAQPPLIYGVIAGRSLGVTTMPGIVERAGVWLIVW